MSVQAFYEIIGYVASVLVAVSLMMTSILKLRILNLIGAAFFTLYGLLIRAYPVAALNFFIVLIDSYFLLQIFREKEYFTLLEVQSDSPYLRRFLRFYEKEIRTFQPDFQWNPQKAQMIFFVLRNMVPAGLFIGELYDAQTLLVTLDFAIPGYRDFKIGKYVYYRQSDFFRTRGLTAILTPPGDKRHREYLLRMGFSPFSREGKPCLRLELGSQN